MVKFILAGKDVFFAHKTSKNGSFREDFVWKVRLLLLQIAINGYVEKVVFVIMIKIV